MSKSLRDSIFNTLLIVTIASVFILFNYEFRTTLLIGFVFAVLTYPLYMWLANKMPLKFGKYRNNFAALITILGVSTVLFFVTNFVTAQLVKEIPRFANAIYENVKSLPDNQDFKNKVVSLGIPEQTVSEYVDSLKNLSNSESQDLNSSSNLFSTENLNQILNIGRQAFTTIFNVITYTILFILAWFNALTHGRQWLAAILDILPLTKRENDQVVLDLQMGIRNVIYANLLSGVIHSTVVVLMMLVFNLPNVFIVALVVFLLGFLPASPSEIGYAIPFFMLIGANPVAAIAVAIIGEAVIIWTNYIFLPKIILGSTEGNPLFIITSVLAGISLFGVMGFIIGPVIMIFVNTLSHILLTRIRLADKKELAVEN